MITVHHLGVSQSERIVWLCEELGIAYELKTYLRESNGAAPAAYKALHPQGTAPIGARPAYRSAMKKADPETKLALE
jgi:glutathione S-transferase